MPSLQPLLQQPHGWPITTHFEWGKGRNMGRGSSVGIVLAMLESCANRVVGEARQPSYAVVWKRPCSGQAT